MKISVIGAGCRGLALSDVLANNGHEVLVYAKEPNSDVEINMQHTSEKYLKGKKINEKIRATPTLKDALDFSDYLLLAVPSKVIGSCLLEIKSIKQSDTYFFINVIKGFENKKTIQQIIQEYFPNRKGLVSVLGPSFAREVLDKNITCVCSVSENKRDAEFVQNLFSNDYFKLFVETDVIGAELYSSMKNAIAIASGIVTGMGYGENTKAGLITFGLQEMAKMGSIMGAKNETCFGLTGLGDLILTCSSNQSRNFRAGYQIGKDDSAANFLKTNEITVEGLATIETIEEFQKIYDIQLPILHSLYQIIYQNAKPSEMLKEIVARS